MSRLRGLLTALVTPFTSDGEAIDEARLRALVDYNIESGSHGLVSGGSTGEFAAMSDDERRHVLEVVVDQAAGRIPVVAQTGAMTTKEAIALSCHAETTGAAAVMVVGPYYEPLTVSETMTHFTAIASSVGLEVMVYNLPIATGVNLLPEDLATLALAVSNIRYVKDTSGDFTQGARLIHDYDDLLTTFVGHDTLYFASLVEGAAGSVNGGGNFIASELVAIYDLVEAGQVGAAREIWNRIFPIPEFLVSGGYVSGVKGAMKILGANAGAPRPPMTALDAEREILLRNILSKSKVGTD